MCYFLSEYPALLLMLGLSLNVVEQLNSDTFLSVSGLFVDMPSGSKYLSQCNVLKLFCSLSASELNADVLHKTQK